MKRTYCHPNSVLLLESSIFFPGNWRSRLYPVSILNQVIQLALANGVSIPKGKTNTRQKERVRLPSCSPAFQQSLGEQPELACHSKKVVRDI